MQTAKHYKDTKQYSRTQVPLQLASATTIHKLQGANKDMNVVDVGDSEFADGLAFVALTRYKKLSNHLIVHKNLDRLTRKIAKNADIKLRIEAEKGLERLEKETKVRYSARWAKANESWSLLDALYNTNFNILIPTLHL